MYNDRRPYGQTQDRPRHNAPQAPRQPRTCNACDNTHVVWIDSETKKPSKQLKAGARAEWCKFCGEPPAPAAKV